MSTSKKKYYVVWEGHDPGVYDNWEDAQEQITGYPGAKYKSFPSQQEAVEAYRGDPSDHIGILKSIAAHRSSSPVNYAAFPEIILDAIAVDAACSHNPGPVEYQGVMVATRQQIFHVGPLAGGTNNIGEFLAIVHCLAYLDKLGRYDIPIYSDSKTAQSWVRNRKAKTNITSTTENQYLRQLIQRAEFWLQTHELRNPIKKWDTEHWGEIPADFGRK